MRSRLLATVGVLWCALTVGAHAQQQFQLYAAIVDSSGKPVASITPEDVRVLDDGVEAKVLKIEPVEWGMKVQILIDNGIGLGAGNLVHLRNGLKGLLEALPEGVEVTFVTTAPQPRFVLRGTTDRKAQLDAVDKITPDSSTGRFVESLNEAMQRVERDKGTFFPTIVTLGTTLGDNRVLDRDVNDLMKRLEQRPTTVHVVMLSGQSSSGGVVQTEVGLQVTKYTRGRYEGIAAPSRIATLLPEIGAQIAMSNARQSKQFRITAERPKGASGQPTKLSMGARNNLTVAGLSTDGRLP